MSNQANDESIVDKRYSFLNIRGLSVHVFDSGTFVTRQATKEILLILNHGFMACLNSYIFVRDQILEQINNISEGTKIRIIAFDRPAFGLTEKILGPLWEQTSVGENPYSIDFSVKLLEDICKHFEEDSQKKLDEYFPENEEKPKLQQKVILAGHSAGGTYAMCALYKSEFIRSRTIALISECSPIVTGGPPGFAKAIISAFPFLTIGLLKILKRFYHSALSSAFFDLKALQSKNPEFMKDQDLTLRLPHWERALNEFTKASEVIDLPSLYPEIKQNLQDDFKILQITGNQDSIVPPKDHRSLGEKFKELGVEVEIVDVDQCGHIPHIEKPEIVIDSFIRFISQFCTQ